MMYECRKSYSSIVPEKPPNKASRNVAAEAGEERELAKGNPPKCAIPRTQSRIRTHNAQERVGHGAYKADKIPVRALWPYHSRQEPDAVVPHVRVCGGGRGQPRFLPRQLAKHRDCVVVFSKSNSVIECWSRNFSL